MNTAAYFYQQNAWSDKIVLLQCFQNVFLLHTRAATGESVLLIMDNHSSHSDLVDPRGQLQIEGLPYNVSSRVQPMDASIIKSFKTHYRYTATSFHKALWQ